ncbi:MAG: GNAT family N-acyltransferase [Myxococcota bacterium]
MQTVSTPVEREALLKSFSEETRLGPGRIAPFELHLFHGNDLPMALHEVGRLREETFRFAGSGSGKSLDLDEFDTATDGYQQLVVLHRERKEIVAGCRLKAGRTGLSTPFASEALFEFSTPFRQKYEGGLIDIGRLFVVPELQAAGGEREGIFALDSVFQGLGLLTQRDTRLRHYFGRLVLPITLPSRMRDLCLFFLSKHFAGDDELVRPRSPGALRASAAELADVLSGESWRDDLRVLQLEARRLRTRVPPLLRAYVSLSPTLQAFGVTRDPDLSGIEEVAILVKVSEVRLRTRRRYGVGSREQEHA